MSPRLAAALRGIPFALALASSACGDRALGRVQSRIDVETIELTAISHNLERFEQKRAAMIREVDGLDAGFAAVRRPDALARLVEEAGATIVQGTPSAERRVARGVPFRAGAPAAVRAILGLGRERRPVAIDRIRCAPGGCDAELVAVARPDLPPPLPAPALADLGPRPWWPPSRSRWDRARAGLEALDALRAAVGPAADVKRRMEELRAMRDAVEAPQARAALVLDAAEDALAAGSPTVDVTAFEHEDGYGATVTGAGQGDALAARLALRGKVAREGGGLSVRVELPGAVLLRKLKRGRADAR